MPYLRECWYAAGWSGEFAQTPVARTILSRPIVLYRNNSGACVALDDRCPHRFAPLSRDRLAGDRIVCGYHGLEFDLTGRCVHNPHGGSVPAALSVGTYPVTERYGMVWIWMGAADGADVDRIPALPVLAEPALSWVHGQLHVAANYELVIDNLLDLTHVEFLHPFLAASGNAARTTFTAKQDGDRVTAIYTIADEPISGLFQLLWEGDETTADMHAHMHWQAPSNLHLDVGMRVPGQDPADGALIPSVHLLTPETEDTTHYFWAAGRNRRHGDEEISGMLHYGTQNAFENEDEPMIRAVRSRMDGNDLFAQRPALLSIDEAAVRARRVLKRLIDAETAIAHTAV